MTLDTFRDYCLAKPAVTEELPFGPDALVFKVAGKLFALTSLTAEYFSFSLKCDPEKAQELRADYPCVVPGYHLNKKHWNTIRVEGSVPDALLRDWIDHSYTLVVRGLPRKQREQLDSTTP